MIIFVPSQTLRELESVRQELAALQSLRDSEPRPAPAPPLREPPLSAHSEGTGPSSPTLLRRNQNNFLELWFYLKKELSSEDLVRSDIL